jgi:hypothetical protein
MNSVYPNSGTYFFKDLDSSKWQRYSDWHQAPLKSWRTQGRHILIFCQRPNGWNMFGNNQEDWLDQIILKIQKHSDRPIMVRMHPGDGNRFSAIQKLQNKIFDVNKLRDIQNKNLNALIKLRHTTTYEKFLGLFGENAVDFSYQCDFLNKILKRYANFDGNPVKMSLSIEKDFLKLSHDLYDQFKKDDIMTLGLDDMIMSIASKREESCYLLQQKLESE